jgi:hypothetical protein
MLIDGIHFLLLFLVNLLGALFGEGPSAHKLVIQTFPITTPSPPCSWALVGGLLRICCPYKIFEVES